MNITVFVIKVLTKTWLSGGLRLTPSKLKKINLR